MVSSSSGTFMSGYATVPLRWVLPFLADPPLLELTLRLIARNNLSQARPGPYEEEGAEDRTDLPSSFPALTC